MNSIRTALLATVLVGVLTGAVGCATPGETRPGSIDAMVEQTLAPERTPPTETELAIACGLDIVRELAEEGFYASRAEAIQATLEWHISVGAETIQESTHLPHSLYIDLLAAALEQLPERERELGPDDNLRMNVTKDGVVIGMVEISPDFHTRYGLTALGFAAADPGVCEESYVGDHAKLFGLRQD